MNWICGESARQRKITVLMTAGLALAFTAFACAVSGRAQAGEAKPDESKPAESKPAQSKHAADTYETLYLTNLTQQSDLSDIQTAMRNVLPWAKIYGEPSQHSISIWATAEDVALARRILADLDRPKKTYKVTYSMTEMDGDKKLGVQRFAMVAVSGEKTELKEGTRVPLITGSYGTGTSTSNSQVQYIDVGLNIEATLDGFEDGARLRTKIERSSVADAKAGMGDKDPVIRQTQLQGTSSLALAKPLLLGSLDVPGSSRRLEVEVVAELVK